MCEAVNADCRFSVFFYLSSPIWQFTATFIAAKMRKIQGLDTSAKPQNIN